MESGKEVDLQAVLGQTGRGYASLRASDVGGELSFAFAGEKTGGIYCTQRLDVIDNRMVRLEACIG